MKEIEKIFRDLKQANQNKPVRKRRIGGKAE